MHGLANRETFQPRHFRATKFGAGRCLHNCNYTGTKSTQRVQMGTPPQRAGGPEPESRLLSWAALQSVSDPHLAEIGRVHDSC